MWYLRNHNPFKSTVLLNSYHLRYVCILHKVVNKWVILLIVYVLLIRYYKPFLMSQHVLCKHYF